MRSFGKNLTFAVGVFCFLVLAIVGLAIAYNFYSGLSRKLPLGTIAMGPPTSTIWFQSDRAIDRSTKARLESLLFTRGEKLAHAKKVTVTFESSNVVRMDLWGVKNPEKIGESVVRSGRLLVMHARNVTTENEPGRLYSEIDSGTNDMSGVKFAMRSGKAISPGDPEYYEMIYGIGAKPGKSGVGGWGVILEGSDLLYAYPEIQPQGAQPHFKFTDSGGAKLSSWCRKFQNGEKVAFVFNDKVVSIAPVKQGQILSTEAFIDGRFQVDTVNELCDTILIGALPIRLSVLKTQKPSD